MLMLIIQHLIGFFFFSMKTWINFWLQYIYIYQFLFQSASISSSSIGRPLFLHSSLFLLFKKSISSDKVACSFSLHAVYLTMQNSFPCHRASSAVNMKWLSYILPLYPCLPVTAGKNFTYQLVITRIFGVISQLPHFKMTYCSSNSGRALLKSAKILFPWLHLLKLQGL